MAAKFLNKHTEPGCVEDLSSTTWLEFHFTGIGYIPCMNIFYIYERDHGIFPIPCCGFMSLFMQFLSSETEGKSRLLAGFSMTQ